MVNPGIVSAPIITRFAPTPSGFLHWGNAFSFVLTWLYAKRFEAKILLRIDDLDQARKRPEFVEDVFRSLDWLGLNYDVGPSGPDDFEARFSQRLRMELYREALGQLCEAEAVFACDCSRKTIAATEDGRHPRACRTRRLSKDVPNVAWRMPTTAEPVCWTDLNDGSFAIDLHDQMRDFVVRRKDGVPAYQLTSVVDDQYFGVNLIIRGEDLIPSTAAQRWLAGYLPKASFCQAMLLHHPLVRAPDGEKLSKSAGAASLFQMRAATQKPTALYERFSGLLGLPDVARNAMELWQLWGSL